MPPKKKLKVTDSDIDWCIKHSDALNIQTFSEVFNYGDKSAANSRYAQILRTKRFNSCVSNADRFLSALNQWKHSHQETTFWENRKVELARQSAESRMRASAIRAIGRLGVEEGDSVAKEKNASSSHAPELMGDSEPSSSHAPETTTDSEPSSSRPSVNCERNKRNREDDQIVKKLDLTEFKNTYERMDKSLMWTLACSGRKVEEVLYMFGSTLQYEHLCHSFVLDPWEPTYQKCSVFTIEELNEIKNFKLKCLPPINAKTLDYLSLYKEAKTAGEVRKILTSKQSWDDNFDRKESHDLDWIRHSYYILTREIECGGLDGIDRSETWLLAHVWTSVDRVFDDVELDVVRGESASLASSLRKNKGRTPQGEEKLERKKMGRRLDMILRKNLELGAGEAGKATGANDTKLLCERDLKLPKALKDMFLCLKNEGDGRTQDMEVVGLLQYGMELGSVLSTSIAC
ncbi:unnamed protein product [Mucor fragilis]